MNVNAVCSMILSDPKLFQFSFESIEEFERLSINNWNTFGLMVFNYWFERAVFML